MGILYLKKTVPKKLFLLFCNRYTEEIKCFDIFYANVKTATSIRTLQSWATEWVKNSELQYSKHVQLQPMLLLLASRFKVVSSPRDDVGCC